MKRKMMVALLALVFVSVGTASAQQSVAYTVAKGYFVRNDVDPARAVTETITGQDRFNQLFGQATTMGSRATAIDFSRQVVMAVVLPVTDICTELTPDSLVDDGGKLKLSYSVHRGEKLSYKMRPLLLLVCPKPAPGAR